MRYYRELINYFIQAKHRRGFGIHSPSTFRLVTQVVEERLPYYYFPFIERIRHRFNMDDVELFLNQKGEILKKSKLSLAKCGALKKSYDQILFRLVNYYKPQVIIELGTTLGFTTLYLATPNSQAEVITLSEKPEVSDLARNNIKKAAVSNIHVLEGALDSNFKKLLEQQAKVEFINVNCQMMPEGFYSYYDMLRQKNKFSGVFILNEPYYWEKSQEDLAKIKSREDVRVVLDLFHVVILLFNQELQKEEYVLRYY